MATPAATLQILVDANTKSATMALSKFDSKLKGIDKTSATATTRTTALGSASKSAGSHLRSAAGYAASAAAAYLSISQAKAAITTTQDLAKTTAGLNRNLGLSSKRASQWGTVAKARDIDTKSLTMSFTTLSRRITDASKGSDTAIDSFKDLGLSQQDLEATGGSFNKQLLLVADAFGEAEGGAVRQQAAQKLLGRGYQTLLPMFAEGSKSLQEQMMWADEYGTTLDKKAVTAQMDLVNAQRESKVAMLGLQVSFAQFLTPALEKANEQFQEIAKIVGSDKLTNSEKFEKVGRIVEKWASKALDAFVEVLPKIVEKAGEAGPRIAGALAKGFINADIWGKLFVGGWLLAKLGGAAAFGKVGEKAGKTAGRRFGPGFAIGLALIGPDIIKGAFDLGRKAGEAVTEAFGGTTDSVENVQGWGKFVSDAQGAFKNWTNPIVQDTKGGFKALGDVTNRELQRMLKETHGVLGDEETAFERTRSKLARTTERQARDVAGNTDSMVNAVGSGLGTLGKNTNNALKAFGASALHFAVNNAQNLAGRQRGGPINMGAPSGDSVPAMLERGEYVLNRKAVSAVGKEKLDALNFKAAKRFATGGIVGLGQQLQQQGYAVAGHTAFPPVGTHTTNSYHYRDMALDVNADTMAGGEAANLDRLYAQLKSMPGILELLWRVADHYDHLHVAMSGSGSMLGGMGNLAKVLLKGPAGPLKDMGQGALDKARKAANAFLSAQTVEGSEPSMSGGKWQSALQQIAGQKGWSAADWMTLVMRESSGDPTAVNPSSGAFGLGQFLGSTLDAYAKYGATSTDPVMQIQAMAKYISDRYGNPSAALAFHSANNWYSKGGMPSLDTGGRVERAGIAQVHPGDVHMGEGGGDIHVTVIAKGSVEIEDVRAEIGGMKREIADFTIKRASRDSARRRQLV